MFKLNRLISFSADIIHAHPYQLIKVKHLSRQLAVAFVFLYSKQSGAAVLKSGYSDYWRAILWLQCRKLQNFYAFSSTFSSFGSLSWSWTRIFINAQHCGSDICYINQFTCSCFSCSKATDFSQAEEQFSHPRKKKLLFLIFFPNNCFLVG